jgi:hypothetical protein
MNLDESQRQKVAEWIAQGLKLSDIQNRLASELGARLTYMEVRLLVDDLKLTPKDVEPKTAQTLVKGGAIPEAKAGPTPPQPPKQEPAQPPPSTGTVSVSVDQLTRPGSVVSGKVTFSDGQQAEWYLDQMGRLGMATQKKGYRPSAGDVQQFQAALESELSKMGL